MTLLTLRKEQILDIWRRYILHRPFEKDNQLRLRRTSILMQTLSRRPVPPETPEDHWLEVQEERLSDYGRRRFKKSTPVPPGFRQY